MCFKLKFTPVGVGALDDPYIQLRGINLFGENERSLMMSSRAVAWRSHLIDIYAMRLPRRFAPRNDRLRDRQIKI